MAVKRRARGMWALVLGSALAAGGTGCMPEPESVDPGQRWTPTGLLEVYLPTCGRSLAKVSLYAYDKNTGSAGRLLWQVSDPLAAQVHRGSLVVGDDAAFSEVRKPLAVALPGAVQLKVAYAGTDSGRHDELDVSALPRSAPPNGGYWARDEKGKFIEESASELDRKTCS